MKIEGIQWACVLPAASVPTPPEWPMSLAWKALRRAWREHILSTACPDRSSHSRAKDKVDRSHCQFFPCRQTCEGCHPLCRQLLDRMELTSDPTTQGFLDKSSHFSGVRQKVWMWLTRHSARLGIPLRLGFLCLHLLPFGSLHEVSRTADQESRLGNSTMDMYSSSVCFPRNPQVTLSLPSGSAQNMLTGILDLQKFWTLLQMFCSFLCTHKTSRKLTGTTIMYSDPEIMGTL